MALQVLNGTLVASQLSSQLLLEAFQSGNLGVSMSIAGFLIPYLAGAAYMLQELGIITERTPLAGASSGALTATLICSGLSQQQFMAALRGISSHCRAASNCQGSLDTAFRTFLQQNLPPDAFRKCSGRAFISITTGPFPPQPGATRNVLHSQFRSNSELIDAAASSSFIPVWSSRNSWTSSFQGGPAYDGYFTGGQPLPPLPLPGRPGHVISISSKTPPWSVGNIEELLRLLSRAATASALQRRVVSYDSLVGPPCHQQSPGSSRATTAAKAAAAAAAAGGKPAQQPGKLRTPVAAAARPGRASSSSIDIRAFRQAQGLDISPGVFHPTCIESDTWDELLVLPGDEATNQHLLQLGRADAAAWAHLTGLAEAAAGAKRAKAEQRAAQGRRTEPRQATYMQGR